MPIENKNHNKDRVRITVIGGGTGLSTLLTGLKNKDSELTAIVTVTDDGGSSGLLRESLDVPPLGDARNCILALSQASPLIQQIFRHRFKQGSIFTGHSLGNLILAALYDIKGGFQESIEAASQLLQTSGKVIPVSNQNNLVLMGSTHKGDILRGESSIGSNSDQLSNLWIEPMEVRPNQGALKAIADADLIVIGPGSLYTSIIPNFLVPGISNAVNSSNAIKVFVCNVATEPPETDQYDANQHIQGLLEHSGIVVDYFLMNNNLTFIPSNVQQQAVSPSPQPNGSNIFFLEADLASERYIGRHDPAKIADKLMEFANA